MLEVTWIGFALGLALSNIAIVIILGILFMRGKF